MLLLWGICLNFLFGLGFRNRLFVFRASWTRRKPRTGSCFSKSASWKNSLPQPPRSPAAQRRCVCCSVWCSWCSGPCIGLTLLSNCRCLVRSDTHCWKNSSICRRESGRWNSSWKMNRERWTVSLEHFRLGLANIAKKYHSNY